jgi:hypothetical protein
MLPSPAAAQPSSTAAALWLLRRRLPLLSLQQRYQPSLHGHDEHFGMLWPFAVHAWALHLWRQPAVDSLFDCLWRLCMSETVPAVA